MGNLDDILASDSAAFLDPDVFGEAVTYKKVTGATRIINAVVNRDPMGPAIGMEAGTYPVMEISVANDDSTGIALTELNVGGDCLVVAYPLGNTPRPFALPRPASQDSGILMFSINR